MIRSFRHKGLAEFFLEGSVRRIRPEHARRLRVVLARLHAAREPRDMDLPGLRLHTLKGDLAHWYAIDVSGNWRVIFRFDAGDVMDVDYVDYH